MKLFAKDRFWVKVDKSGECWLWLAALDRHGYGAYYLDGGMRRAHRVAYELVVGPVDDDLVLDHLCHVHACVNPAHLEPVTQAENVRRAQAAGVIWGPLDPRRLRTHCKRGHAFDEANTYRFNGRRICRACRALASRQRRLVG